jgi:hypothetical protein
LAAEVLSLKVEIQPAVDADPAELDELSRQLRQQILETDVDAVGAIPIGEAPPGARAGELVAVGSLLVTLTRSAELLKSVVAVIQDWLQRSGARTVELQIGGDTLKITGVSSEDQHRLVELFVERHTA